MVFSCFFFFFFYSFLGSRFSPQAQAAAGIQDSPRRLVEDTLSSGDGTAVAELVETLAQRSAETHRWLKGLGSGPLRGLEAVAHLRFGAE